MEGVFCALTSQTEAIGEKKHPEASGRMRREDICWHNRGRRGHQQLIKTSQQTHFTKTERKHEGGCIQPSTFRELKPANIYLMTVTGLLSDLRSASLSSTSFPLFKVSHRLKSLLQPSQAGGTMTQTVTQLIQHLVPMTQMNFSKVSRVQRHCC